MWHSTCHFRGERCRCECIMQLEKSAESSGDLSPHRSLRSDAAAHSVHYDPGDINQIRPAAVKKSPQHWRGRGRWSQNSFPLGGVIFSYRACCTMCDWPSQISLTEPSHWSKGEWHRGFANQWHLDQMFWPEWHAYWSCLWTTVELHSAAVFTASLTWSWSTFLRKVRNWHWLWKCGNVCRQKP